MADAKICSNPQCCEYTCNFVDGSSECIKCMTYEPKKREVKRFKREQDKMFETRYAEKRTRAKEERERERDKERKRRQSNFF